VLNKLPFGLQIIRMLGLSNSTEKAEDTYMSCYQDDVINREGNQLCLNLTANAKAIACQFCPNYMEDRAKTETLMDEKWGPILISFVADGHGGKGVSSMIKKNIIRLYEQHFENQNHTSMGANIETLDHIMISVLRNVTVDLQKEVEEQELRDGSTLVAVFAFLNFQRLYVLNCGDSRFMMFETETGNIINTVSRIIDLEDGFDRKFSVEDQHPSCTESHNVLGKIRPHKDASASVSNELMTRRGKAGEWSHEFLKDFNMDNDTKELRGIREWGLWLDNEETNPEQCLKFIHRRKGDGIFVIGKRGRLNITRAFGDIGYAMHRGEIYIADIPMDREVSFLLCSDGLEECIHYTEIPKFICNPEDGLKNLFSKDHKFRQMCDQYKEFFIQKGIGLCPEDGNLVEEIDWYQRAIEIIGESHLPIGTTRERETLKGSGEWIRWAYKKFSSLPYDHENNKFHKDLHECVGFRLKFIMQCALCRISCDNISGVLVSLKPEENSSN